MVQSIDDTRRRQQRIGRVPPHNLEAEESLLGAMLLSGDAIAAAVNIHLSAEDFYKPVHGHVYDAICALYAQGEPVDPVTVAEELRRADLHDLVGGLPALLSLEARTPATSNAARYARIVEDHALLRRLIGVAGEIAELGYDLPEDVAMAIDRAEAMVYEVAQKRVTDSMEGIQSLLEKSLDHIEALYERGEEITGIPTGFTDLDGMLAGLQPSNLVIVGARPAAGKTALGLGMAAHAAMHANRPVLVFSLEMSHLELTQRLLCAEARVDASRLRTGRLQEPDWPKISHAVGRLGEANIFIDDNPHLTIMEIRAKARRLKSRLGDLGLIVVDYLQLMTGRPDAENRQVEVSEISRGLKILARELECPVIGLSQLSRQLENRADKRPMLADLRESGCVPASTRILRADNGQETTIGELVLSQEEPLVWSVDEHQRLVARRLVKAFPSGRKPVFRVKLASGRQVEATANHPFLTVDGWSRLDALSAGSFVATPRRVPTPVQQVRFLSNVGLHEGYCGSYLLGSPNRPRRFSRDRLRRMADIIDSPELRDVATSDLFWDEIVEIVPVGVQPTFDATVEDTHNFIGDGVVLHNSLEQDADVVLFIYRDEIYNPESADRGTAEIIIAKHRNGPTGTVHLAFVDRYTLFANMAKGV